MKSTAFLVVIAWGARSAASSASGTCADSDDSSLLQAKQVVRKETTSGTAVAGDSIWTLVLQTGDEAYPVTREAVGVLNEAVRGFAKLSDEAINALPTGDVASATYERYGRTRTRQFYKLTSDPLGSTCRGRACTEGRSGDHTCSSGEWDTMFLRTANDGGYNDEDLRMGIAGRFHGQSLRICNAASLDECMSGAWTNGAQGTIHDVQGDPNRFDTRQVTSGSNCNQWFTGYSGSKCRPPHGTSWSGWPASNRCFSRGGSLPFRTNVKLYKLTGVVAATTAVPTTTTTAPISGHTADGCVGHRHEREVHPLTLQSDPTHLADVRCCSLDGLNCASHVDEDAIGDGCVSDVTFSEAQETCSNAGRRLCIGEEVQTCCGTGCLHDHHAVWVDHHETAELD